MNQIVILKNYSNIPSYLSLLSDKEVFINGSFTNIKQLTLVLDKESKRHFNINFPVKNTEYEIIDTLQSYQETNESKLSNLRQFCAKNNIHLSWLQELQINEMNRIENNTIKNIQVLKKAYDALLPPEKDMSFLDF